MATTPTVENKKDSLSLSLSTSQFQSLERSTNNFKNSKELRIDVNILSLF